MFCGRDNKVKIAGIVADAPLIKLLSAAAPQKQATAVYRLSSQYVPKCLSAPVLAKAEQEPYIRKPVENCLHSMHCPEIRDSHTMQQGH